MTDPGADEAEANPGTEAGKRQRRAVRVTDKIAWDQVDLDDEAEYLPNGGDQSMRPAGEGRATKRAKLSPDAAPRSTRSTVQTRGTATETDLETDVAWAVGLDPYALGEEEDAMGLAAGFDESHYVKVRNHVLTLWRADVSRWLTEEEAALKILPRYRPMVSAAWQFLTTAGYINFGVGPGITQHPGRQEQRESVIVIGAGLAGMSAARQLRNWGYQVVVLEGRNRAGGRVYTRRLDGEHGEAAVADLGGSIITGADGNPLAVLARQMGIPLHDIDGNDVPLYLSDGTEPADDIDEEVQHRFNRCLDGSFKFRDELGPGGDSISLETVLDELWRASEQPAPFDWKAQASNNTAGDSDTGAADGLHGSGAANGETAASGQPQQQQAKQQAQQTSQQHAAGGSGSSQQPREAARLALERKLMHWHMANIEFANAARLGDLSMRHWDQDDPYEHPGAHCFLPGGNLRLVQGLAEGIPILYSARASLVQYSRDAGVTVHTADGTAYSADAVIVTVPLGVLKRPEGDASALRFQPQLPARKRAAIERLGFGVLNKVVLLFPHAFWGKLDMFGHIQDDPHRRGELYLFYTYADVSGGAVLAALVAGKAACDYEGLPADVTVQRCMQVLRNLFRPKGIDVPEPLQALRTRWGADPLSFGSYSSVAVGARGAEEYETLAEPVAGRVFFAGEATTAKYPATMHGAFATGLREAANAAAALAARRAGAHSAAGPAGRPAGAAAAAAACMQVPTQLSADAAAAGAHLQRAQELVQRVFGCAAGGAAGSLVAGQWGMEPAFEFGCITAVFGPPGSGMEQEALVRIDLSAGTRQKTGSSKTSSKSTRSRKSSGAAEFPQYAYARLSRAQLTVLQEEQSDEDRLALLTETLGLRLIGREVNERVLQLMEAIAASSQSQ